MKSSEEFQSFYQSTLVPIVEDLENERKKLVKNIYVAGAVALVFIIIYSIINKSKTIEQDLGQGLGKQYTYTGGWSGALVYVGIAGAAGYFFGINQNGEILEFALKMK